ncbi:MAG TPA: hypothetical protein V6D09_25315 [Leptolyngbyaceae cyanobacterium]
MYSEEDRRQATNQNSADAEEIPMLQRRTIHPDSLKFMDMAKEVLDNPTLKKAIDGEQQKPE